MGGEVSLLGIEEGGRRAGMQKKVSFYPEVEPVVGRLCAYFREKKLQKRRRWESRTSGRKQGGTNETARSPSSLISKGANRSPEFLDPKIEGEIRGREVENLLVRKNKRGVKDGVLSYA